MNEFCKDLRRTIVILSVEHLIRS